MYNNVLTFFSTYLATFNSNFDSLIFDTLTLIWPILDQVQVQRVFLINTHAYQSLMNIGFAACNRHFTTFRFLPYNTL